MPKLKSISFLYNNNNGGVVFYIRDKKGKRIFLYGSDNACVINGAECAVEVIIVAEGLEKTWQEYNFYDVGVDEELAEKHKDRLGENQIFGDLLVMSPASLFSREGRASVDEWDILQVLTVSEKIRNLLGK